MEEIEKKFSIDKDFIGLSERSLLSQLGSGHDGLTASEYETRLQKYGYNVVIDKKEKPFILRFFSKFIDPLEITLIVCAIFSYAFAEKASAYFVLGMAIMSALVEFIQEEKAGREAKKLSEMVRVKTCVIRGGKEHKVSMHNIVPGDIIKLQAGDLVPADLRLIEANDVFNNQSTFTGESFPVQKFSGKLEIENPTIQECNNILFMGSSIVSGTGLAVVVQTGKDTEFGRLSKDLSDGEPETTFDRGVKNFTSMMLKILMLLGLVVFVINYFTKHDVVTAFLFALVVAVGLIPDMLPMVIALNLSKGARAMAKRDVKIGRAHV